MSAQKQIQHFPNHDGTQQGCRHVDWIAALIAQALVAQGRGVGNDTACEALATDAYRVAKAMAKVGNLDS